MFIISKKEGNVGFIMEYSRINHKLYRKTYPLPRIGNKTQYLEGFQYATTLYINMGNYTIRILTTSQDM